MTARAYKVVTDDLRTALGGLGKAGPEMGRYEIGLEVDLPRPRVYAHRTLERAAARWRWWRPCGRDPLRVVVLEYPDEDGGERHGSSTTVRLRKFRVVDEVPEAELVRLVGPRMYK